MPAYQPPIVSFAVNGPGIAQGNPSYLDLDFTASSFPLAYPLGWHDAWCADNDKSIFFSTYHDAAVYSSYEYNILFANSDFATLGKASAALLPGVSVPFDSTHPSQPYLENLDIVNWLLNNIQTSSTVYNDTINSVNYSNIPYYTVTGISGFFTYGDVHETTYKFLDGG